METAKDGNNVDMQWSDNDIIVASFMEASTAWTQAVITLILHKEGKENSGCDANPNQEVLLSPWIRLTEDFSFERAVPGGPADDTPRLFTTNLNWEKLPKAAIDANVKTIYVYSRLKDVIFSTYVSIIEAAAQNGNETLSKQSFAEFVEAVLNGADPKFLDEYFENIKGYWKHRDDDNVQILFESDLIKDHGAGVLQIASFLEKQLEVDHFQEVFRCCKNPREFFSQCHAQVHVDRNAQVEEDIADWSKVKLTEHGLDPAFFCV
ncbi:hypothetical protein RvY_12043 [Ramazzottius varieornatus]|uniref:Sulfotransferase domain-containing protein n=1 Tax=Ramazzottius varieornatus TaxID=947166 RepID=A0A1D1VRY1_RAMVA|nr:hypothetical protein RvY_12043 [Ramazzottius varieornatus]